MTVPLETVMMNVSVFWMRCQDIGCDLYGVIAVGSASMYVASC